MYAAFTDLNRVELTLYTDALIARGSLRTRQHRVSDILNHSETPFLVLEDVTATSLDGRGEPITADVAQINLDAVLFAVVDTPAPSAPELRSPKLRREALVAIPPFRVTGTLHLLAGSANLRDAITELVGRFLPVTDAEYEAPSLGLGPTPALMVAVNHHRAQILARFAEPGDRPEPGAQAVTGAPGSAAGEGQGMPVVNDPWAGTGWSDDSGSGRG